MKPAEQFIELANKTGLFRHCRGIPMDNVVCLLKIGEPKNMTLAVTASGRELRMNNGRIEKLFMQRLENALRVAVAHGDETGVTKSDMARMLKEARDAITEKQAA